MGPAVYDYNKRMNLLSLIKLSGGHCKIMSYKRIESTHKTLNFKYGLFVSFYLSFWQNVSLSLQNCYMQLQTKFENTNFCPFLKHDVVTANLLIIFLSGIKLRPIDLWLNNTIVIVKYSVTSKTWLKRDCISTEWRPEQIPWRCSLVPTVCFRDLAKQS